MIRTGNPPDATRNAGTDRRSNLPHAAIVPAVNSALGAGKAEARWERDKFAAGKFVSNFIGYHGIWYREFWNARSGIPENQKCQKSGHTHVGIDVTVPNATAAVEIQLDKLFESL